MTRLPEPLSKKTESVPSPALRTTRSVKPSPFRSAAMICAGSEAGCQRADLHEATVAVGIERDRVIVGIDTGEDRALVGVRNPGDVARRIAGVDRDGGLEGAGLPGDALAIEDIPGAVDDQDIVGAVAVDVGHQGRGMRSRGELAGVRERAVAVAQQDRHVVGSSWRWPGRCAVAVEVTRTRAIGHGPHRVGTWGWKVPSPLPSSTDTSLSS